MSGESILVLVLLTWTAIGVGLSLALGRRGHDGFEWLVLGTLLGPFAIVLGVEAWRHDERSQLTTVNPSPVQPDSEGVDVLVGYDGSSESADAIATVVSLFGARLGQLTLATVIPFDGGLDNERQARAGLAREAQRVAWLAPELAVVRGHPAAALVTAAVDGGYDVLAIGATGSGRAHLFGSVARELTRGSAIPVLLGGRATRSDCRHIAGSQ